MLCVLKLQQFKMAPAAETKTEEKGKNEAKKDDKNKDDKKKEEETELVSHLVILDCQFLFKDFCFQ